MNDKRIARIPEKKSVSARSLQALKICAAKARNFQDGADLIKKFNNFLSMCECNELIPSKPAFCNFLGISYNVFAQTAIKRWPEEVGLIDQCLESILISGGLTNGLNATFAQFLLKNKYGYEAAEISIKNNAVLTPEEREKLIQSYMEAKKSEP